jgi:hypothetical protein
MHGVGLAFSVTVLFTVVFGRWLGHGARIQQQYDLVMA